MDTEVRPEQVDDRPVDRRLAVRGSTGLENKPPLHALRAGELVHESGLSDSGLSDDAEHLDPAASHALERAGELVDLRRPPHEAGQAPAHGGLQRGADRTESRHRIDVDGSP